MEEGLSFAPVLAVVEQAAGEEGYDRGADVKQYTRQACLRVLLHCCVHNFDRPAVRCSA